MSPTDPQPEAVAEAADVLSHGGLVVFPTDTFYGLAADPRNSDAIDRVFQVKGRSPGQALPLVAASLDQVERAVGTLSVLTRRLARSFWPGPLTLVVEAGPDVVCAALGEAGTVAIRVPNQAVARALCARVGYPVVSTSANRSGRPAPSTADEAIESLGGVVDLVLDSGPAGGGEPSTIVDARGEVVRLLRAGAVPFSRVLEAL